MAEIIYTEPLSPEAFEPFGDILDKTTKDPFMINQGMCKRFDNLARMSALGDGANLGISIFNANPRSLPYTLNMMERHPLGSQAFIPMTEHPFLVIVAADAGGKPEIPRAFITKSGQGINYLKNIWHGVLTPLYAPGLFAVVDRIGEGKNLEEYWFDTQYRIE